MVDVGWWFLNELFMSQINSRSGKHAETSKTPTKLIWFLFEMYRSQFARTKSSYEEKQIPSFDSNKEFTREELSAKFVSQVTVSTVCFRPFYSYLDL